MVKQGGHAAAPAARWNNGDRVYGMCALPGGRLLVGGTGGEIRVYDPRNGHLETILAPASEERYGEGGHSDTVLAITYSRDGIFSAGVDLSIQQWDLTSFECVRSYFGHKGLVASLCVTPGHGLFSASDDRTVKQWSVSSGRCTRTFKGHHSAVNAVVASDFWVFSGARGVIRVWSISGGDCRHTIQAHEGAVWSLRLLPEGRLVSCSSDGTIKVWEDPQGQAHCARVLRGHEGQVRHLTSHSCTLFSSGKDGTVVVWDTTSWSIKKVLMAHEKTVTNLTLQNNQLCSGSLDKMVCRWDVTDLLDQKQTVAQFIPFSHKVLPDAQSHTGTVHAAAYGEDIFYSKQRKKAILEMKPGDAVQQYNALPINFVVDKIEFKIAASKLVLDIIIYIPFLLLFVFFFLVRRDIEPSYFITRSAVDMLEGSEILRQPWCVTAEGSAWNNHFDRAERPSCDTSAGVLKQDKRFGDIAGPSDFEDWLMGVVMPFLWAHPEGWGHSDAAPPDRNPPLLMGKYLIGSLRLRTLRMGNSSCSANGEFFGPSVGQLGAAGAALRSFYGQCFGAWDSGGQTTASYACADPIVPCRRWPYPSGSFDPRLHVSTQRGATAGWTESWFADTGFMYHSAKDPPYGIGGTRTIGRMHDLADLWPAGGFAVDIPFNATPNDAFDMAAAVADNGFVDGVATRFATVEFMTYAPFLNYFTAYKFYVEVAAGGAWLPTSMVKNFRVFTESGGTIAYDVIFLCFVLYLFYSFFSDWYQDWRASHSILKFVVSPWNVLEIANLMAFLIVFGFRFQWWATSLRYKHLIRIPYPDSSYPVHLDYILDSYMMQVWTNSINTVLTFLKLLKFVRLNPHLNILTRTLACCQQSIIGVLILFVWTVLGYAMTGAAVFGGGLLEYRSIDTAYSTLLRYLLGDFDYESLREENKILAPLFFWTFEVLTFFILLNFIVAVISAAFDEVSSDGTVHLDLDATLRKTFRDAKAELLPQALQRRLLMLRHRRTRTSQLNRVRQRLVEGWRNKLLTADQIENQEHRDLLANVFIPRDDFMNCIGVSESDFLTTEFLMSIWLDCAWEYHNTLLHGDETSDGRARDIVAAHATDQVGKLLAYRHTLQDLRGRFEDLGAALAPLTKAAAEMRVQGQHEAGN
eukprot:TRINITY_DN59967_c0_g1_i1.p1 TRINITY_DN59967_c0_g1~~TRINITY_DN59967_c0_g1_i1.p1  ORF type:complete len:1140 (+),score=358.27 TRINITY_DN59967_c0_g1_i1:135-3554(+)